MTIAASFSQVASLEVALASAQKTLSGLFTSKAKTSTCDGMGGEMVLDFLLGPVFSSAFGGVVWEFLNNVQTVAEYWGEERALAAAKAPTLAIRQAQGALYRAKRRYAYASAHTAPMPRAA